jgi:hypothetical protein
LRSFRGQIDQGGLFALGGIAVRDTAGKNDAADFTAVAPREG